MTGQQALTMACNLIAEGTGTTLGCAEFTARAPYILAAFCGEARVIDKRYRDAFALEEQPDFDRTHIALYDELPLCDRIAPIAATYLAAMLMIDEQPSLSEVFSENCRESLAAAYSEIPAELHSIKDVYA